MTKTRHLSFLLCLLLALVFPLRADQTVTEYSAPDDSFALRIPAGWEHSRADLGGGLWMTLFHPRGDDSRSFSLVVYTSPPELPLLPASYEPIAQLLTKNMLKLLENLGTVAAQPTQKLPFRDGDAWRTDFTFTSRADNSASRAYFLGVPGRQRIFLLGVAAPQNDQSAFEQIEALLKTLQLEPKLPPVAPEARGLTHDALLAEMDTVLQAMKEVTAEQSGDMEAPATANLTAEQARTAFEARERELQAAAPHTRERAAAAKAAMQTAAQAGWIDFEAGRYDEAATWFERRGTLKKERYEHLLAWHEAQIATAAARLAELRAALQAPPAETASMLRLLVDGYRNLQAARAARLQLLATDHHDSTTQLKYAQLELDTRQQQWDDLRADANADAAQLQRQQSYLATAYSDLGGAQEAMARFEDAAASYRKALELRRALPADMPRRLVNAPLRDLGYLYANLGDVERARDFYTQALAALDESEPVHRASLAAEPPEVATLAEVEFVQSRGVLLNNLGTLALDRGDYRAAADLFERAQQAVAELADEGFTGAVKAAMRSSALGNVVTLHADSGETEKALQLNGEVVALRRRLKDDRALALALINQAGLLMTKSDWETARNYVAQARQIFVSEQDLRGLLWATSALAVIDFKQERLDEAARLSEEGLTLARKAGDQSWIGSFARALGNIRLKQDDLAAAQKFVQEAQVADATYNAPSAIAATHDLQGRIAEKQNKLEEAAGHYRAAIALLEQIRATAASESAFADQEGSYRYYDHIVRVLIKLGRAEEAFNYLNRAKSKRLRDEMQLSSIKTGDEALQTLLKLTDALEKRLHSVRTQLQDEQARPATEKDDQKIENLKLVAASTQAEFFQTVNRLKTQYPNYEKVITVSPKELKKAQAGIPDGAVLVQYAPLGEQLYIFLVTRDSLKIYTPPAKPEEIWQRVREFRQLMEEAGRQRRAGQSLAIADWNSSDPATAALRENLTALHAMLIAPIWPELEKSETIAFIPTGLLYYLPMHALAHRVDGRLRFLIEEKPVAYLAAADVLSVVQTRDPARLGKGLLALGDPAGADLPQALAEVKTIAPLFPDAQVLSGDAATKNALHQESNLDRRVLHFATHGVLNPAQPIQSYIQLAPADTPGDARLTVGEVYGLDLSRLDLVTLSACQTALGERNPDGSEITSLAESFSVAGAPSVIASLWSVADDSTRDTMVAFYRALTGGAGKAAALREAQLAVLRNPNYRHPYFWAPFELMGDWR